MARFKYLLTSPEMSALQYIENAGYVVAASAFDEDHDPIGPELRAKLVPKFMSCSADDLLRLTEEGMSMLVGD